MPWKALDLMSLREEFLREASQPGVSLSGLCRRYQISRTTAYKWRRRFALEGPQGLVDHSRRPANSPGRCAPALEARLWAARERHPTWGARKLKAWLQAQGQEDLPALSTITAVLRRGGYLTPQESLKHRAFQRFCQEEPNQLWQRDFKGPFALEAGGGCHALTLLDDHSRFLLALAACPDERTETVRRVLIQTFRAYGLPERMLMDNGSPWGDAADSPHTGLTVWLLRLGVRVTHGRPRHPQTQGKDERLHRTLQEELLNRLEARDLACCQAAFDPWRDDYNQERPHEALGLRPPAQYYRPSPRAYPEFLPPVTYPPGSCLRQVDSAGKLSYRNQSWRVGKAFRGQTLRLLPMGEGCPVALFYGAYRIGFLSPRASSKARLTVSDVSEQV